MQKVYYISYKRHITVTSYSFILPPSESQIDGEFFLVAQGWTKLLITQSSTNFENYVLIGVDNFELALFIHHVTGL